MVMTREVNVLEMAKGAILEQIDNESAKIMSNILDPNTDAKKARKLTITLTFKADENREFISYEAQAKSTIAPIKPIAIRMFIDEDKNGKPRVAEITRDDPNQIHIFEDEEQVQNVLKLRSV